MFWATAGGMGLTGFITEATVRLLPIETAHMRVDTERTSDLDGAMARMADADGRYRYSVAWIDCLARGRSLGRAVLEFGDHARLDDLHLPVVARPGPFGSTPSTGSRPAMGSRPPPQPVEHRRLQRALVPQIAPEATRSPGAGDQVLSSPRRRGRLEPDLRPTRLGPVSDGGSRRRRGHRARSVETLSSARCASFLSVLKRFGPGNPGPLSFPRSGWTLALDLPARIDGLAALLDGLDEMVAAGGGRVYLAKDARLRPELLAAMYPALPEWRATRDRLDPERRLCSDLARRLPGLIEPGVGRRAT